jgi:hypothetical protein
MNISWAVACLGSANDLWGCPSTKQWYRGCLIQSNKLLLTSSALYQCNTKYARFMVRLHATVVSRQCLQSLGNPIIGHQPGSNRDCAVCLHL